MAENVPPPSGEVPSSSAPPAVLSNTAPVGVQETVDERLKALEAKPPKDGWDRADVLAKFLSSVVIALVGLLITWSMQRQQDATTRAIADSQRETTKGIADAQLKASKEREETENRLEQGKLTVQLLDHLTNKDPAHRKLAVITFRHALPETTYDEVTAVLAQTDQSPVVQIAAIHQLSSSRRPQASGTLAQLSRNSSVDSSVRQAAGSAVENRNISQLLSGQLSWVFSASQFNQPAFEFNDLSHGVFTYFLLKGISGDANRNEVSVRDLADYLAREIPQYTGRQNRPVYQTPQFAFSGAVESGPILPVNGATHPVFSISIGISNYRSAVQSLQWSRNDAEAFSHLLTSKGAQVVTLLDPTRTQVLKALLDVAEKIPPQGRLILYFSGHSFVDDSGRAYWVMTDSEINNPYTMLSLDELQHTLSVTRASETGIFLDTCFSTYKVVAYEPGPK